MKPSLLLILAAAMAPTAHAAPNYDVCIQLYQPDTKFPVICLSGTNEEGIGGSSARFMVFGTNTYSAIACGLSSSLSMKPGSLELVQKDVKELVLSSVKSQNGRIEGDAQLGHSSLKFMQLRADDERPYREAEAKETHCSDLAPGELRQIR